MSSTAKAVQLQAFDLSGPLPTGVTVLEASAGTGKTFALAALATRFVAEGMELEQLLIVTFTRVATGELRERVRERLVWTEAELARRLSGDVSSVSDPVVRVLTRGDAQEIEQRRARLADAVANFDAATIETTHGFCQRVLDSLGTLGETDPDVTFVENVDELVDEVIDDLYVRRFYKSAQELLLSREEAAEIAAFAISNPTASIHPRDASDQRDAMRAKFARAVRGEYEARKRRLAVMTHDDQLTRLLGTLVGGGANAVASLRGRYRAVLIDEFQDTDPIQWEIVQRAFAGGGVALVLIGDPKQAIYAFRGADVYAYLQAAASARQRSTLDVNRRSDETLLDGLDALFGRARLGHPQIIYRHVSAAPGHHGSRLRGAPVSAALRLRLLSSDEPAVSRTRTGFASTDSARQFIARDLAADIAALLRSDARIEQRTEDGSVLGSDPVNAGDVAVLVRSHYQADLIQEQLGMLDVPAVIGGAGSVFRTAAAGDWQTLLEALERPAHGARARAAALTPLIGMSGSELALVSEAQLDDLHQRLYAWARLLRERGVATLAQHIFTSEHVGARLLAALDGERHLTDLQHVAELMHGVSSSGSMGLSALAGWLRERIAAAGREGGNDALTRRLDSDADAVQVLTFHRSKGLEFPFVYCPFLWDARNLRERGQPIAFHDPDAGDARAIDVALQGAQRRNHLRQHLLEERGEELRLIYVALTRARHQAVLWWAGSWNARDSALGRLLFSQDADGNVAPEGAERLHDAEVLRRTREIEALAPHAVVVEEARLGGLPASGPAAPEGRGKLEVASFHRDFDMLWRRTSFSGITAAAHATLSSFEPEQPGIRDEPAGPPPTPVSELPLSAMASGPRIGTVVHRALQLTDFSEAELEQTLAEQLRAQTERPMALLACPVEQAALGLALALRTPLGGELGGLRLTDVKPADRLNELSFELPLAGGDAPQGRATLRDVATLLRRHLAEDDPLHDYAARLGDPSLEEVLRGYLTGTIDLVLRSRADDGRARYTVIDYKTNWLAAAGEELSTRHYRPAALAAEMRRSHYVLQALLYSVALHRYLRWRLPAYEPERDLTGVHYLFLRGMLGAADGDSGVFAWRPPAQLIIELSDLFDGG